MTKGSTLMAVSACAFFAACAPDTARPPTGALVRDSAGVTIVENTSPVWSQDDAWTVSADPFRSVGLVVGPEAEQFSRIRGVLLRSDGALVVADGGSQELRAFADDGALLWRAGGAGDGPGEFRNLSRIVLLPGDSLLAWDLGTRRISVLDPGGSLVRTVRPQVLPEAAMAAPVGLIQEDVWIFTSGAGFSGGEGAAASTERASVGYYRARLDGTWLDSLTTLGGREAFVQRDEGSIALWFVPFGRDSHVAVADGRVAWGENDRPQWWVEDAGGRRRLVRLEVPRDAVTDQDWSRAVQELVPEDAEPDMRRRIQDAHGAMERPAIWPLSDDLHLDPSGHLWVRQYRPPWTEGGTGTWWVFDEEGRHLGAVVLPGGLEVHQILEDAVVGVVTDELGVERVQVHRLQRN